MSFSTRATASASRIVNRFSGGATIVFASVGGTFDPVTRTLTPSSAGMTLACTRPTSFSKFVVDGTLIQANDVRVLVSKGGPPRTFEITAGLFATVGGTVYRVVNVLDGAGGDEIQLRGNPS